MAGGRDDRDIVGMNSRREEGAITGREADAARHLQSELARLELMLTRQVLRLRAARLLRDDELRGLYVTDAEVDALLGPTTAGGADVAALTEQIDTRDPLRDAPADAPLARLAQTFELDRAALDVVLLAVAPELELRYETLYAYVQNDVTRKRPTVELALQLLSASFEERTRLRALFEDDSPLLAHGLVHVLDETPDRETPLPARVLVAAPRVVGLLLGRDALDAGLGGRAERVSSAPPLDELALPEAARRRLAAVAGAAGPGWLVVLHGPEGAGRRAAATAAAARADRSLLSLDLGLVDDVGTALAAARLEAALTGAALHLDGVDTLAGDPHAGHALVRGLAAFPAPVFAASAEGWQPQPLGFEGHVVTVALPETGYAERRAVWEREVAGSGVDTRELAGKFVLSPSQIHAAVRAARDDAALRADAEHAVTPADLERAARSQSSGGLRRLAQRIEPVFGWDDIVLPPQVRAQLRDVTAAVRQRQVVYADWGFERKLARGKGLPVLFSGASGTGKTMAAEVIAGDTGLDLYKVDLATVVDRYVGETEKHLREIFGEARASNAIVFLDEADALLGKRSEVKDAHDRYANIEVAFLLQQLEEHDGPVILATNFAENLDDAFVRRMHHTVEFPFPDARLRAAIWRRVFPPEAPLAGDVDVDVLARFELSGGHIRNAAVGAALLAAEAGGEIRMHELVRAVAREFQKLGRLPSRADFGDYLGLLLEPAEQARAELV
jgi:Winged helix domain, variant/ATPase family associated with various cellular activities (AAA)